MRYIAIKVRVIADFKIAKQATNPQLPENKLKAEKLKLTSEEKQEKYNTQIEKNRSEPLKIILFYETTTNYKYSSTSVSL